MRLNRFLYIFLELGKVKVTFFVAISAAVGYILASGQISINMLFPILGIFLLAYGSAGFNEYQERIPDGIMNRTKNRPIPSKLLSSKSGFIISLFSCISGLVIISLSSNFQAFLLGILTLLIYNFIYTPHKRRTSMAVFPGALVGAIPPIIGWVSGGGNLANPQIWALSLFFFIWQIPHFWLLQLIYEDDYKKAGFPVLTEIFNREQLRRITYIWIIALAVSCLFIPFMSGISNNLTLFTLLTAGFILIWRTKKLLNKYIPDMNYRIAFRAVNLFVLLVVCLLVIDSLI